ncbi:MAG TPA: hypothetical protein VMH28_03665 [Candidatus Acidoferrales bacterium]|nr:hypothetical protein [Candidatus Acidoferrales bacterium]
MSFEWLRMRIQEEVDRRKREASTLSRLPVALEDLYGLLQGCIADYTAAFGAEASESQLLQDRIKITVRELQNSKWQPSARVEVSTVPELPGFRIERGEYSLAVEVGILPNGKLYYRDCEQDKYLTLEELTRRILDRAFFPNLKD